MNIRLRERDNRITLLLNTDEINIDIDRNIPHQTNLVASTSDTVENNSEINIIDDENSGNDNIINIRNQEFFSRKRRLIRKHGNINFVIDKYGNRSSNYYNPVVTEEIANFEFRKFLNIGFSIFAVLIAIFAGLIIATRYYGTSVINGEAKALVGLTSALLGVYFNNLYSNLFEQIIANYSGVNKDKYKSVIKSVGNYFSIVLSLFIILLYMLITTKLFYTSMIIFIGVIMILTIILYFLTRDE